MNCDLKERLVSGKTSVGTWVTIGHTDVPDILEAMGFEWLVFDAEHAPIGPESISRMIQAIDASKICPLVRVGDINQYLIKSALDMGAHGVVCPLVNSPALAEEVVKFVKYPPQGIRGVAPRKAADYGLKMADYIRTANSQTIVVAQIETREALDNLDGILSVKGVDVAFVGPTDLTMSLGLLDDRSNPRVIDAMKRVIKACESHGKVPGVMAASEEEVKRDIAMGFRFISLASDVRFLIRGAKAFLDSARGG
jgi:2-keto-3-deoxy-L-rhamnonate aldolase RhmA